MPITLINISLDQKEEIHFVSDGYIKVLNPLNKLPNGNKVYLWYKEESGDKPITRIQFSYRDWMAKELREASFFQVNKNINDGKHGSAVYMWYIRGSTDADVAIQELHVSNGGQDEAKMVRQGWERLTCDLNVDAGGEWTYLWVKRVNPVFISELTATCDLTQYQDLYQKGYTRLDDYTNKFVEEGQVYIWYLNTTDKKKAIQDLKLSNQTEKGYARVNMDLRIGTGKDPLYLCYEKGGNDPIKGFGLIVSDYVHAYEQSGAFNLKLIYASSSMGSYTLFLSFYR